MSQGNTSSGNDLASDPLAFQADENMTLDFDLDPTVGGLDATGGEDPTIITTGTRKQRVKLTAERLLSRKGLPYILEEAPKRLRISKRRSAYDNLTSFIQFYQLWAHDLYPKAKFRDFVSLCESLGKTDKDLRAYRMNLVRKDMGVLLEDFFDDAQRTAPVPAAEEQGLQASEQLQAAHGPQNTNGLFVTEEEDPGRPGSDDDDILYSSHRRQRTVPQTKADTDIPDDKELEELTRNDAPSDDEIAMLREMDGL